MMSSDLNNIPHADEEQLAPDIVVYRAVLRKSQINETKNPPEPSPDLFIPRPREKGDDNDGLSVGIAGRCTHQELAGKFRKCYAVISLTTREIQALGLQVVPDPEDE